ncbi:tyramine beta-hydroxylase-like [Mytilus galloprovincialis]|uniref:tyramine beta-hydroxylase-like n=1 Tax=Mytilus galloprovincialis TaxID=29158 RepID=UPI003F7B6E00
MVWDTTLCQMDSDGDGMTNGYELGDPNCVWVAGQGITPERVIDITHPGICDPFNAPQCYQANTDFTISCTSIQFNCPATQDPGVTSYTYSLPPTPVPVKETTYMCMVFDFPQGQDIHQIAYEPFIDNANVLHHMTIMGCMPGQTVPPNEVGVPHECGMGASSSCQIVLGVWSLGFSGHCLPDEAGIRIGPNKYTQGAIQLHWTNPLLSNSLVDGSGMKLYFTPNLRPNDAGIFITGQIYLNIPSGVESHQEEGECPSDCTNQLFTGNIHVFSALNHMHYLGSEMKVQLHRNGTKIADLTDDLIYVYDSPQLHEFSPAIEVMPGDSITTKCTYKSTSRSGTTLNGQSTFDEMCFGLLYYYPVANLAGAWTCISFKGISQCEINSGNVDGCNIFDFFNFGNQASQNRYDTIINNCPIFGAGTYDCMAAQMSIRNDPCMAPDVYDLIIHKNNGWYTAVAFHTAMLTHNRCFMFYDLSVEENEQFYNSIVDNCEPWGSCLEQCDSAIDAQKNHACMRHGSTYEHLRSYAVINQNIQWIKFFAAVASCKNM